MQSFNSNGSSKPEIEINGAKCITDRRLSVCVLYSMIVLGGKFRTRFNVSRMRDVVV